MKQLLEQPTAMLGVWGLNIVSFLNNSLPYLQFVSLVLAIVLSACSLVRMSKSNKNSEEDTDNDPII